MRLAALFLAALLLTMTGAGAAGKVLHNVRGAVTYQPPGQRAQPLAPSASVALDDRAIASTAAASLGSLTLPDSSLILLGQDTRVQLGLFREGAQTQARFIIYNGKTRFHVEHPHGAKAAYTFVTPTASVAVRGTMGDISVDENDGMRLNVYHLSSPRLPVVVKTIYGQRFTLHGGQKLWVRWLNGRLVGRETRLSRVEIARFAEFGPPPVVDGGMP